MLRYRVGATAEVWANGTHAVRLYSLEPKCPNGNFGMAILRWKELLGMSGYGMKDAKEGKWIVPAEFSDDALLKLRRAFAEQGTHIDLTMRVHAADVDWPLWRLH